MRLAEVLAPVAGLVAGCSGPPEQAALAGPPCPQLAAEAFRARAITPEEDLRLGAAVVRFRFGRAQCKAVGSSGGGWDSAAPVCHFSAPALLHVTTASGRDVYFDPGVGQPATLALGQDTAQCVLDAEPKT